MASFDLVLPIILQFEGGYVDDPTDPGGETNRGITMATFRECSHQLLGLVPSSENLRALTEAQAGIIYRAKSWLPIHGDDLELQELANIVCDFYVNAGTHATCLLQQILRENNQTVVCDGCIGPGTLQALHNLPQDVVYRAYKAGRIAYYEKVGQRFPQFLRGWLQRVAAFPDL